MKKVLSQIEYLVIIAIIVLAFFPWIGLFNVTAIDITQRIIENIDTVASVDDYAIALTVIMAVVTLVMGLLKKGDPLFSTLTFALPIIGFAYAMIKSSGDYFSSIELAYIVVLVLSFVMLLKQLGIIKIK